MSLKDEIRPLSGNKRRYILLRISGLDPESSVRFTGIAKSTRNTWLRHPDFVELHRRIGEFSSEYRQEAIQLLRRDTQREAALLESKIIAELMREVDNKEYSLLRTRLGSEVYNKVMSDLDAVPQIQSLTWEDRRAIYLNTPPEQISEGEVIDAIPEAENIEEDESQEREPVEEG